MQLKAGGGGGQREKQQDLFAKLSLPVHEHRACKNLQLKGFRTASIGTASQFKKRRVSGGESGFLQSVSGGGDHSQDLYCLSAGAFLLYFYLDNWDCSSYIDIYL